MHKKATAPHVRSTRKGFHRFENIWTGVFILIGLITIIRLWTLPIAGH